MRKIYKSLIMSGMVVGLSAGAAMATSTINVYSDADSDSSASPYRLAIEGYKTSGPDAVADKAMIAVINVNQQGPSKIELAMTNGNFDSASAAKEYHLGLWVDANSNGQIDAAEVKNVVDNVGSADTVLGNIVGGKLTFSAATVMKADANGGDGGEVLITANSKLVVLTMSTTTDSAADSAIEAQGATKSTACVDNTSAQVGFNFTPVGSLTTSSASVTLTVTENSGTASASTSLASFMNEYVAAVDTADDADGVIDITAARMKFTGNSTTDTVTVNIADRNAVDTSGGIYNEGTNYTGRFLATKAENTGSVDKIYVDLYGSNSQITSVKQDDGTTTITYDSTNGKWRQEDDVTNTGTTTSTFTIAVNGTSVINTRTFRAGVVSTAASGFSDITYLSDAAAGSWTINGYQATIPYMAASSAYRTTCLISNSNTSSADISADIISTESGATLTSLTNLSLGSVAAAGEKRIDFDSSVTPYNAGNVADTANTHALTGLSTGDRYGAKLTVTGTPANISMNCMMTDPGGGKRLLPVLPVAGTNLTW